MDDEPVLRWKKPDGWKDVKITPPTNMLTKESSANLTFGGSRIIVRGIDEMNGALQNILTALQDEHPDTPIDELIDIEINIRFKS